MVAQAFHANLADLDTTAQVSLGSIYELDNKRYKYVKFSGTTAINVGDVLCYVSSDQNLQTVDGANTAYGAGVAINAVGTGTVLYGWIQITGIAVMSQTAAGSPAFGDYLTTSGATAPNATKSTTSNMNVIGSMVNVAGKVINLDCEN